MASLHTRGQLLMAKMYCDVLLLLLTSERDNVFYYNASVTIKLLIHFENKMAIQSNSEQMKKLNIL